jgi:hypothetical protein
MIYPASYDISILQNATWSATFRATQNRQEVSAITVATNTPTFSVPCHGFVATDKVVFTGGDEVPCGLELNRVYFVIATGLTTGAFQVSTTSGGSSISVSDTASGTFYVAEPVNMTGYTVDSDIKGLIDGVQVATFTPALTTPADGEFTLSLSPATTAGLAVGRYGYDVSLTAGSGARYYWLTGVATVQLTYSRT